MKTLYARFADIAIFICCPLIGHPPITSAVFNGEAENMAERTRNLLAMRGAEMTVNCCCGRKMVDPIWRPWWRKT